MPCFYCGKRVSLVRQMSDPDFCSDDHRRQYHALTRLALNRLLENTRQAATPESRPEPEAQHVPPVPAYREPAAQAQPDRQRRRGRTHAEPAAAAPAAIPIPSPADFQYFQPGAFSGTDGDLLVAPAEVLAPSVGQEIERLARKSLAPRRTLGVHAANITQEPPPADLIQAQPRAATRRSRWQMSVSSGGRAVPRPTLPPIPAAGSGFVSFGRAELIREHQIARDRRFGSRLAVARFLPFETEVQSSLHSSLRPAAYQAFTGFTRTTTRPQAVAGAASAIPISGFDFLGRIQLPSRGGGQQKSANEFAATARTQAFLANAPRQVALPYTHRFAPAPGFPKSQIQFPVQPDASAAFSGMPQADLEYLGYPVAARPLSSLPHLPAQRLFGIGVRPASIPELPAPGLAHSLASASWRHPVPARAGASCAARRQEPAASFVPAPSLPENGWENLPVQALAHGSLVTATQPGLVSWTGQKARWAGAQQPRPESLLELPAFSGRIAARTGLRFDAGNTTVAGPLPIPRPAALRGSAVAPVVRSDVAVTIAATSLPQLHSEALAAGMCIAPAAETAIRPRSRRAAANRIPGSAPVRISGFVRLQPLPVVLAPISGEPQVCLLLETALPSVHSIVSGAVNRTAAAEVGPSETPIVLTSGIEMGDSRIGLLQQTELGLAGLTGAGQPQARKLGAHSLGPCGTGFEARKLEQPRLLPLPAANTIAEGRPAHFAAKPASRPPKPTAATVTLQRMLALDVPAGPSTGLARQLATASREVVTARPANRAPLGIPHAWQTFAVPAPECGTNDRPDWKAFRPVLGDVQFAPEPPQQAPRSGSPIHASSSGDFDFGTTEIRRPESSVSAPQMPEFPPTLLASPAVRQDDRTARRKGRNAPIFRLSNRPSRLPIFHTVIDKAQMPAGAFAYCETDDWDDERTIFPRPGFPATSLEPVIPSPEYDVTAIEELGEAELADVPTGPYAGNRALGPGFGEISYAPEIFFVATAIPFLSMDFETMADSIAPRWRSALKSASGLFRGVMMFIPCILALNSLLTGCSARGSSLRETIQSRASMHLEHNFSQGLDGWYGAHEWSKSWVRDAEGGFVRVGEIAIYRPSQQYTNYRLEFLGQIETSSIGWVYRAPDLQNYYAAKLVVVRPGPLPQMALVRYQVVGGQEREQVQVPVRMVLHNGQPYRIQQDVEGNTFTTSIEGEVIDFWTDDRLRTGGVGFFGDANDHPHVYWMKLTHNDDFWGNLCSTIAPNN